MTLRIPWRRAWERWKLVARAIGNAQAHVLLTIFYFVVVPAFAVIVRLHGDPLAMASGSSGHRPGVERGPEAILTRLT